MLLLDFAVQIMDLDCNRGSRLVSFKLVLRIAEKKLGRGDILAPFSLWHYLWFTSLSTVLTWQLLKITACLLVP